MSHAANEPVIVLDKARSERLTGHALVIDIRDPDGVLGPIATLCFRREARHPAELLRTVLLDHRGRGRFYGWTPGGLCEVSILVDRNATQGKRRPSATVRTASLPEVAARGAAAFPRAMWQTVRLLPAGNMRGFRYRFGRLYDSLNQPDYRTWLEAHRVEEASFGPPATEGGRPAVLVSIIGDGPKAEATRRSLARQSYRNIREVPAGQAAASVNAGPEPCLWMRLAAGDRLEDHAVARLVEALLANPEAAAVYCDEDQIGASGHRSRPFFHPAWNPPLAETGWLAPGGALFRLDRLNGDIDIEKLHAGRLLIEAARAGRIVHIPRLLVSRAGPRGPVAASVAKTPRSRTDVSVVIPTRDRANLLRACLKGLFKDTRYDDLDVIVVDNGSREPETLALLSDHEARGSIRCVREHGPFNFSQLCNLGVANARHDLILLLNNDVEPLDAGWLDQLVAELDDPDVGAAGAFLFFPDGFVQHAGVTLGAGSVARHSFQFRRPGTGEDLGLMRQRQEMSAVTAACLLTRRSLWDKVGGMDAERLAVAFNDVDYCLKLREIGKRILWTPHARLMHRESVSRGRDDTTEKLSRFAAEEACMHERWGEKLKNDPFYNPNLSLVAEDHTLDIRPRDRSPRSAGLEPRNSLPSGGPA